VSRRGLGAAAIAAAAVAAAALAGAAATGSLGSSHAEGAGGFTLRGHVGGLYPGAGKRLVLVVHNHALVFRGRATR
jgi:hypothetical protein